jgi:hypothetical protein
MKKERSTKADGVEVKKSAAWMPLSYTVKYS